MKQDLQTLTLTAYDVALGTATWDTFLQEAQAQFSARASTLLEQASDGTAATIHAAAGLDSAVLRDYVAHYGQRNVLLLHREHLWSPGLVRTEAMACPPEVLLRSEYYNDFLRRNDMRYMLSTTALRADPTAVHLTLFRGHRTKAFDEDAMNALAHVAPHVQRAAQLRQQVATLSEKVDVLEAVVERVGRGAALLDESCRPQYVNQILRAMTSARDGLLLTPKALEPELRTELQRFRGLVADAVRGGSGGTMTVSRRSAQAPFLVLVAPFYGRSSLSRSSARLVLVTVGDPSAAPSGDPHTRVQQLFALTPGEARIALLLAGGQSLQQVSDTLGISILTARTHLKRILQKTATHRQAELVRLVSAI